MYISLTLPLQGNGMSAIPKKNHAPVSEMNLNHELYHDEGPQLKIFVHRFKLG